MTDVKLLPLPEPHWIGMDTCDAPGPRHYTADQMHAYARANVAHATAQLQAKVEALRAEVSAVKESLSTDLRAMRAERERAMEARQLISDDLATAEARADKLEEALEDIRSRSSINLAMRSDQFALAAYLGDIHQIADAALSKENSND